MKLPSLAFMKFYFAIRPLFSRDFTLNFPLCLFYISLIILDMSDRSKVLVLRRLPSFFGRIDYLMDGDLTPELTVTRLNDWF